MLVTIQHINNVTGIQAIQGVQSKNQMRVTVVAAFYPVHPFYPCKHIFGGWNGCIITE
jgi:hypothetical protein